MASLIKATSDHVPPGQAVFFRAFFALPVIVAWLALRHELHTGLKTTQPMSHVWRGLVGTTAMGLSFTGLGLLPLPEVTAIGYAAPILVVIFAAMFLGEKVRAFRLSMVALGARGRARRALAPVAGRPDHGGCRRDAGCRRRPALRRLRGAGAGLRAQDGPDRKHLGHRVLLLAHCHGHVVPDAALGLGLAAAWVLALLVLAGLLGGIGQILLTSAYRMPTPR
jgi:uncharacterized membrane protein